MLVLSAGPPPVLAADPVKIDVLLPMTGSNAFSGKQESDSLQVIESLINRTGGISGRPVRFAIQDDQSSPQIAVQLADQIIAGHGAVILGPSLVGDCGAILPLVSSGPVLWCFSPGFHPPKDSFGFSSNTSTTDLIGVNMRYFHALGLNKIALLVSNDASGQDGERSIDAALKDPTNAGMAVVDREHFTGTDVSVGAQIAHIKASGAQAMFAWTTGTPLGTVLRGITDGGLDIPVATTNANAYAPQLKSYAAFMPKMLLFAGQFSQAPDQLAAGPAKRKIAEYYAAFKASGLEPPQASNSLAWDSTLIVIDALRKDGPDATARQIHDYIESLHGWIGINGEYDFRAGSQRGLTNADGIMVRWDSDTGSFTGVSKPGGVPLK